MRRMPVVLHFEWAMQYAFITTLNNSLWSMVVSDDLGIIIFTSANADICCSFHFDSTWNNGYNSSEHFLGMHYEQCENKPVTLSDDESWGTGIFKIACNN